jgi:ribosome-binding ATPase YchF (GTP1/OBG family)
MSERMFRAQILLDPNQHRILEELAHRQGRSISAITRQVIDAGLHCIETESEVWKKREPLLASLRMLRNEQPVMYSGNLIEEARQEREEEQDRIWRNES